MAQSSFVHQDLAVSNNLFHFYCINYKTQSKSRPQAHSSSQQALSAALLIGKPSCSSNVCPRCCNTTGWENHTNDILITSHSEDVLVLTLPL